LPTEQELNKYYERYNETYEGGHSGGQNLNRYSRRYFSILKRIIKKGEIIDIGPSKSPFPNLCDQNGFSVTVMDFVKPKELATKVSFIEGNLNDKSSLNLILGRFDIVSAWAVIEHVQQPKLAVEILTSLCKPSGYVIVSTPEIGTFLTKNSVGHSGWFHPPMHLHLISPLGMRTLFAQNDFALVKWGRLELNLMRYCLRYGLGLFEAIIGVLVKKVNQHKWDELNNKRVARFKGILYFIFKRPHSI